MFCKHTTKVGIRCKAYAIKSGDFCFTHDPRLEDARKIAVRKGGLSKKPKAHGKPLKRLPTRKPSDTLKLLEDTINRVRTEPMTPQQASCIASLTALALKAMQMDDPIEFND